MDIIGLPKGSGKRLKVMEKSVKSQGILKWILSGNPVYFVTILQFTSLCFIYVLYTFDINTLNRCRNPINNESLLKWSIAKITKWKF